MFTVQAAMPRDTVLTQELCADHQGLSLHPAVRCNAQERQRLEQLCRTTTRPALANERVQCNSAGQVVLKLKTAYATAPLSLDMERCLNGTGELKIVAAILRLGGDRSASCRIWDCKPGRRPVHQRGKFSAGCLVGGSAVRAAGTGCAWRG